MFSTIYAYRYYIDGRYLAILQNRTTNVFPTLNEDIFVTPTIADSSAIYVRYTIGISAPTDENSNLEVNDTLGEGLVHYVKFKFAEDSGDERAQRYHYNKFLYFINREISNRRGNNVSISMPSGTGALL